jgi:hypothetical protein
MIRVPIVMALLCSAGLHTLAAQAIGSPVWVAAADPQPGTDNARASFERSLIHNGKWVVAAGVAAFTVVAAREHRLSKRDWDSLLTICRADPTACLVGPDGRYLRADAEALYQRSRAYDRRANRWLVGAQLSLIAATALFIVDLRPGEGPENIPFPAQLRVGALADGATVGVTLSF